MKPTTGAEVYALAGSIWTCVTDGWALAYDAVGFNRKELRPAQMRVEIANRHIPLDAAAP